MQLAIIVPSQKRTHCYGIFDARPETMPTGAEISIVFVQRRREQICDSLLNNVLALNICISLSIGAPSLSPFLRLVMPLIKPGRCRRLHKAPRVDQTLCVDGVPFGLRQGAEIFCGLRAGHV